MKYVQLILDSTATTWTLWYHDVCNFAEMGSFQNWKNAILEQIMVIQQVDAQITVMFFQDLTAPLPMNQNHCVCLFVEMAKLLLMSSAILEPKMEKFQLAARNSVRNFQGSTVLFRVKYHNATLSVETPLKPGFSNAI